MNITIEYITTMATITSLIIALAAGIWAIIERYAKKLLNGKLEDLRLKEMAAQSELSRFKEMYEEEKMFLAIARKKIDELQKLQSQQEEGSQEMAVKSSTEENAELDVTGLVDVTDSFKIGEDERVVFFEFYKDKNAPREIRWRLKAKNNKVLADSGEGYGTKQNLKKALSVMLTAIKSGEFKSKWKS